MRGIRICLIAAIALGIAGVTGAAGPMVLTSDGDFYSAGTRDNQVVLTARYADGSVGEFFVPQSAAAIEDSLQVGVDEATGAVYLLWQKMTGLDAKLRLAGYLDGTWIGPRTFAGGDGTAALNPVMMVHRPVSAVVDGIDKDGEPVMTELATTFLHITWWSRFSEEDPGFAKYVALELNANGVPRFNEMEPVELQGLFPYGLVCFEIESGENLHHPKLFIEPGSNNPHIFATDLGDCFFQILELVPEVEEQADATTKRRRQIIILRKAKMIAMRSDLPLAKGKLVVGSGLKILMHWDADQEEAIQYLELDTDGVSDTKILMLDQELGHEKATELIRELVR